MKFQKIQYFVLWAVFSIILTFLSRQFWETHLPQTFSFDMEKIVNHIAPWEENQFGNREFQKMNDVYSILNNQHYENGLINSGKMFDRALKGFVDALDDPYTVYMDSQENSWFTTSLKGQQDFEGIGAVVAKKDDGVMIEEVLKASPAQKAGLRPLDMIVEISGHKVQSLTLSEAVEKIRWPKWSKVELTIVRTIWSWENQQTGTIIWDKLLFKQIVIRDAITVPSVTSKVFDSGKNKKIWYINISIIGEETEKVLKNTIKDLSSQKIQGVILDLRWNGGGFLPIAVEIASHFIPKWQVIVSSKYKIYPNEVYQSQGYGDFEKLPVVVLVDGLTASAWEIIALALKEQKMATLIGTKTFGKWSIQTVQDLDDGSSLKYTIGKWYSPKDENIDHQGIVPDIEIKFDMNLYTTKEIDNQLEKAKETLKNLLQ